MFKTSILKNLALAALLLGGAFFTSTQAKTTCGQTPMGQKCVSQVDFKTFAAAYHPQEQSQWCWAATISMLFGYYGHPVGQESIVQAVYGRRVNLPSGNGWNIASQVNRQWEDADGETFSSHLTAAYDFQARVLTLNNAWLVNELDQDRPFIVGTAGHAVVATAIEYYPTPMGPNVVSVGVFDPWPGRGARNLTPPEMVPMHVDPRGQLQFVATVTVDED